MKRFFPVLTVCSVLFIVQCSETDFRPPQVPASVHSAVHPQSKQLRPVRVVYRGELIDDVYWLRTYTVSRLFSHRATNQSGSFVDLMQDPIRTTLALRGYGVDEAADRVLTVELLQRQVEWYPPQEFIQTVRPHRRGRYRIALHIRVTNPDGKQWTFERRIDGEAYPGEEIGRIESMLRGLLAEFLQGMLDHLPTV